MTAYSAKVALEPQEVARGQKKKRQNLIITFYHVRELHTFSRLLNFSEEIEADVLLEILKCSTGIPNGRPTEWIDF